MSSRILDVGSEIAGYRIESVIGRGGMGVVYLADHLRLKRKVALKVLAPELSADERFRDRFIKESELAASLEEPNIVPIYDAGEAEGHLYIAMRYVHDARHSSSIEWPTAGIRGGRKPAALGPTATSALIERIDAATNRLSATIPLGARPGSIGCRRGIQQDGMGRPTRDRLGPGLQDSGSCGGNPVEVCSSIRQAQLIGISVPSQPIG